MWIGLRQGTGAAAYAVYLVRPLEPERIQLAMVDAIHLEHQTSAFAMEVIAADRAIQAIRKLMTSYFSTYISDTMSRHD